LEEDYASHSRRAMEKLIAGAPNVPGLNAGGAYATIRRELYPAGFTAGTALSALPPVNAWKDDIRNPAVIRALTELRKVVNALIKKYGKPQSIHIELARDIRNSRQKRKDIWKQNQDNQKRRANAVAAIFDECKLTTNRRRDIEKWLLAEECNRECPYCGNTINMRALMGDGAEFNIEHIYPRRYLDDSYLNKTIACRTCNDFKGDRTPALAFSTEKLEEILGRVERFQGTARDVKLARFKTAMPDEEFTTRQLNDTRYNSRLAAEFLGLLFGGKNDAQGKQRIFSPTGQLTGNIRANWQLNDILSGTDEKERDDHRHHAIDAIVIALMDQQRIHQLANSAEESEKLHDRHFFKTLDWPWPRFKNDVAYAIEAINVSHRSTRTIAGPLHAESIYSKNLGTNEKPEFRIRKELQKLSVKEIEGDQIVEPSVRAAVQAKYRELGGGPPAKVFADRSSHPALKTKDGREIPIHKVRIRVDAKPRGVGKGVRQRNIASGKDSNYASMIYALLDKDGKEVRWEHEIITRLEAHERLSANHNQKGEKVLIPGESATRKFKFALLKNDMLLAQGEDGRDVLYRVQKFSQNEIQLCLHTKTTVTNEERTRWDRISSVDTLRKRNARKASVSAAGETREGSF
jgi:CRISPR-associated endonuclease Csn1